MLVIIKLMLSKELVTFIMRDGEIFVGSHNLVFLKVLVGNQSSSQV